MPNTRMVINVNPTNTIEALTVAQDILTAVLDAGFLSVGVHGRIVQARDQIRGIVEEGRP